MHALVSSSSSGKEIQDSLGDSTLELSYEPSSFESEEDGVPEGADPYMYEPLTGSNTGESDSSDCNSSDESDSSEASSPRLLILN